LHDPDPRRVQRDLPVTTDIDGKPVERTLREMGGGEVMAAISWHHAECARLEAATAPFIELVEAVHTKGAIPADTSTETVQRAARAMRAFGEAEMKAGWLLNLVQANMPEWHQHEGMGLGEALRRFWRAA
jgi:hypothetical protein